MDWIRLHPLSSAATAAGILVLVGGIIVLQRAQTVASTGTTAWSGDTAVNFDTQVKSTSNSTSGTQNEASIIAQAVNGAANNIPAPSYTPSTSSPSQSDGGPGTAFDYNSFLSSLTEASKGGRATSTATSADATLAEAYAFIPQGLVSTTSSTAIKKRSALQDSLYQYGNEVGSYIQSYDKSHTNATNILQDQITDRNNGEKIAAVQKLGQDLENVGAQLNSITDTPQIAVTAQKTLANSYIEIGQDLQKVPETSYDSDFVAAIKTYDTATDTFTKNFVKFAFLFSANGVNFSNEDPGSVFTFTQNTL